MPPSLFYRISTSTMMMWYGKSTYCKVTLTIERVNLPIRTSIWTLEQTRKEEAAAVLKCKICHVYKWQLLDGLLLAFKSSLENDTKVRLLSCAENGLMFCVEWVNEWLNVANKLVQIWVAWGLQPPFITTNWIPLEWINKVGVKFVEGAFKKI